MPSSVTLLAVGRWPATEKLAVLVSPPPIASTPGASVATVLRSDAAAGSRATSSLPKAPTVAPATGWLSGPITVPTMMSVVAPTWATAWRGTVTVRTAHRASGPRYRSRVVMLRSYRSAADRKADLGRSPGRYREGLGVGAREAAVARQAGQRHRVVAGGDPGRGDAVVGADGAGLPGVQSQ